MCCVLVVPTVCALAASPEAGVRTIQIVSGTYGQNCGAPQATSPTTWHSVAMAGPSASMRRAKRLRTGGQHCAHVTLLQSGTAVALTFHRHTESKGDLGRHACAEFAPSSTARANSAAAEEKGRDGSPFQPSGGPKFQPVLRTGANRRLPSDGVRRRKRSRLCSSSK